MTSCTASVTVPTILLLCIYTTISHYDKACYQSVQRILAALYMCPAL